MMPALEEEAEGSSQLVSSSAVRGPASNKQIRLKAREEDSYH